MSAEIERVLADIEALATNPNSQPDVKRLAGSVLLLFRITGQNRQNNLDAFGQIAELGKRQSANEA